MSWPDIIITQIVFYFMTFFLGHLWFLEKGVRRYKVSSLARAVNSDYLFFLAIIPFVNIVSSGVFFFLIFRSQLRKYKKAKKEKISKKTIV